MSRIQKAIVGLLVIGWCYASYLSMSYMYHQQSEDLYCGTFVGRYGHQGRYSTTEYIIHRLDNGYTYEVYSPSVSATKNIGDRICFRQRYMDVYGGGGLEIVSVFQGVINGMLIICLIGFVLWKLWKLAGKW